MLALTVQDLSLRFPDRTLALDGVRFDVKAGQRVALLGHNGSGKSTLLRCLIALLRPSAGRVTIGDSDPAGLRGRALRRYRSEVGFVFQAFELVSNLTAFHNVLHGAYGRHANPRWWFPATAPADGRDRVMACLDRVGLADKAERRADTLSGGQQQKLALARMLMQEPKIVLADEPVANLDPRAGREVMDLLWDLAEDKGLTVLCALHQPALARSYADRIVGLSGGRLVLNAAPDAVSAVQLDELYAQPPRPAP